MQLCLQMLFNFQLSKNLPSGELNLLYLKGKFPSWLSSGYHMHVLELAPPFFGKKPSLLESKEESKHFLTLKKKMNWSVSFPLKSITVSHIYFKKASSTHHRLWSDCIFSKIIQPQHTPLKAAKTYIKIPGIDFCKHLKPTSRSLE